MDLVELLNKAVELKASDVHITVNLSPIARINGKFQKLSQDLLTNNDVYNLASQLQTKKLFTKLMNKVKQIFQFLYLINTE